MTDSIDAKRAATHQSRPIFVDGFCQDGRQHFVLAAAVLASSMGFIDGTVVSIAMPAIRSDLTATLDQATWINNGYMLTLSALILSAAALGDRFGLARVFRFGLAGFVAASLACALAPTPDFMIVARALQGIGAAIMVPGSLAMISRAYPRSERGRAIGIWAAASAFTTASGPIIGGLALSLGGPEMWRWIFAINLPLGAAALGLLWRGIGQDTRTPDEPVDILGAVLATLGLGLLAWAFTHLEATSTTRTTLLTGVGGVVVLILFVWQEHRRPHPMLPLHLFANRTFSAANIATFALYFGLSAILFYLPMLTVSGWGITEIYTTLAFAPLSIFIAALSTRFGRLADNIGPGPVITGGATTVAIGFAALALTTPLQDFFRATLPAMCLVGLGMSMVVAPLSTAVMNAADDSRAGIASGVNNAISRIAGLMSVALMGSIASIAYHIAGGVFSYGEVQADAAHVDAMGQSFAVIAWTVAGLAAASALVAAYGIPRQTDP